MAENSKIEWCDHTFNPWEGCTKVSPGCANCYAEARDLRFTGGAHWGKGAPRRRTREANWKQPLRWNKTEKWDCPACDTSHTTEIQPVGTLWECHCTEPHFGCNNRRPRVFCASLADWLDDEVPIEWLIDLLRLIYLTQNLDWLLLTKRPGNFHIRLGGVLLAVSDWVHAGHREHMQFGCWLANWLSGTCPASNVWIGTTVEDRERADKRIPELLQIPAKVRFLSCEPLLGSLEFSDVTNRADAIQQLGKKSLDGIHWIICGGESGPNARPMHPAWARSLRDQSAAAGVPFLFKQWGEWFPERQTSNNRYSVPAAMAIDQNWHTFPDGHRALRIGKQNAGRLLDGIEHNNFPTS